MARISDKQYYLTADKTTVVATDDPRTAYLLAGAGAAISDEDAERYGLVHLPEAPVDEITVSLTLADWGELGIYQKIRL